MYIQPHSEGHKYGKCGGASPSLFWKSEKVPWFWKKSADCVHLWVKFPIQNVSLKVSRRKRYKMFLCWAIFSCDFLTKCLPKCPSSTKSPRPWKIPGCTPTLRHYSLWKTLHLWQCSECICLNCSVICTVTLCYVLHQTHSEF